MAEEGANALWSLGQAAHVVDDSLLELPLAAGERPGGDGLLEIAVQALVGVEVRAVGREVENLDLIATSAELWANLGDGSVRKAAYRGGWKPA